MLEWIDPLIEEHGAARITELVRPFLSETRLSRIDELLASRVASVWVAIERPQDPHNAAAVVRTSEALGAMRVDVVSATEDALHARKTTQGAFHWMETHHHDSLEGFWGSFDRDAVTVAGAIMDGEHELSTLPVDRPLCMMLGNESDGLSKAALEACDTTFRIPMFGMSESLNLSVTAALSLYDVLGRRRALLGRAGDLAGTKLERERARCYCRSVEQRLVEALL